MIYKRTIFLIQFVPTRIRISASPLETKVRKQNYNKKEAYLYEKEKKSSSLAGARFQLYIKNSKNAKFILQFSKICVLELHIIHGEKKFFSEEIIVFVDKSLQDSADHLLYLREVVKQPVDKQTFIHQMELATTNWAEYAQNGSQRVVDLQHGLVLLLN